MPEYERLGHIADVPPPDPSDPNSNRYERLGVAPSAAMAPLPPDVGYWKDIVKGSIGGLGRGVTGVLGLPGDARNLVERGFAWGLNKMGLPPMPAEVQQANEALRPATSTDIRKAVEPYTGEFYEPKTVPGQYASTIGEFAPGAVFGPAGGLGRVVNTVIPALASETAGQATKGTAAEPYARFVGGVGGGVVGAKAFTPVSRVTPQHQALVDVLDREARTTGLNQFPLTAGNRTGSGTLRRFEASAEDMPFAGAAMQRIQEQQGNVYDRIMTARMADQAALDAKLAAQGLEPGTTLPNKRVYGAGIDTLGDEYNRLSGANTLHADPQFAQEFTAPLTEYERLMTPSTMKPHVKEMWNDVIDKIVAGGGSLPGDVYQAQRSRLRQFAQDAYANKNSYLGDAYKGMQRALDAAMQRGLSPQDAAAWTLNNQRYANMKQLEAAVAAAGEHLSPQRVASSVRTGRRGQYAQGSGNMDELVDAASTVLKPYPSSGTAARMAWMNPAKLLTGGLIGKLGLMSTTGQRYLANQAAPQSMRDVLAQTLLQQEIAQGQRRPEQ